MAYFKEKIGLGQNFMDSRSIPIFIAENVEEKKTVSSQALKIFLFKHFLWEFLIPLEFCQLNLTKQWMLAQVLNKHCAGDNCTFLAPVSTKN